MHALTLRLVVKDVVVFLDREQGGKEAVEAQGLSFHSVVGFSQILHILEKEGVLKLDLVQSVKRFIASNQVGQAVT